jgi:cbb3-type cytochrome c oxidase subunit III
MYLRNNKRYISRLLALIFTFVVPGSAWFVSHAQQSRQNLMAQKLQNPVAYNAESIEAGKKLYQRYCASCHGPQGKGDGSQALAGGTPSDLTDDTWDHGSTDGEIFVVIRDGVSSDMLAYKEKLTEQQMWQVVNYLRSIGPRSKESK